FDCKFAVNGSDGITYTAYSLTKPNNPSGPAHGPPPAQLAAGAQTAAGSNGSRTRKVAPSPGSLVTSTVPPRARTSAATLASPSPLPGASPGRRVRAESPR